MIRPILTELSLFILPFVLYGLFLVLTRAGLFHPDSWSWRVLAWLTLAALLSVLASFVVFAQFGGEPARSTYVPAHVEDGKLVPGTRQ